MISNELYNSTSVVADELADLLQKHELKIVFAESCTAGLVSAILAQHPGISKWLCGSAVTYRVPVKEEWLQIDTELIKRFTAVSPEVTMEMARSVLAKTNDADLSIAITGHLESGASDQGTFVILSKGTRNTRTDIRADSERLSLQESTRSLRQWEAAKLALNAAIQHVKNLQNTTNITIRKLDLSEND